MEVFFELVLTIAFSLLLSFLISKLLSVASTGDTKHHSVLTSGKNTMEKEVVYDRKFVKNLKNSDRKSVKRVRFVDEVDEFEKESVREKFEFQPLDMRDNAEIDTNEEVFGEIVAVGSGESFIIKEKVKAEEVGVGESKKEDICGGMDMIEEELVEEIPERTTFREIAIELVKDKASLAKNEEVGVLECQRNEKDGVDKNEVAVDDEKEGLFDDSDDDWEGIESTALEKLFGAAVVFVGCSSNADCILKLDSDVQMQLYGFHKVATEGPCREPQPMALKVSARAKWNAWQQLGNMSPEVAMEQYITLLSMSIPGWMGDDPGGDSRHVFPDAGASGQLASDLETFAHNPAGAQNDSKLEELKPCVEGCALIGAGGPDSVNRDKQ